MQDDRVNFEDCPVGIRVLQVLENVTAELRSSKEEIAKLNKKLFIGNGTKALQSRVDMSEAAIQRFEKILWFIGTTVTGSLIASVMGLVLK